MSIFRPFFCTAVHSGITFDEFTEAVTKMKNNKAPGIDGLPVEFYKTFWDTLGRNLFEVGWNW